MRDTTEEAGEGADTVGRMLRERREFLAGIAATTGGLVAGCTGGSDGDDPGDTPTMSDPAAETDTPTATGTTADSPTGTATPGPVDRPRPDPAAYGASPAVPPEEEPVADRGDDTVVTAHRTCRGDILFHRWGTKPSPE